MHIFSLFIQPLIDELQEKCDPNLKIWCAKYDVLIGPITKLVKSVTTLKEVGTTVGYYLEIFKSKL